MSETKKGYVFASVEVTDPETYAKYRELVPATIAQYGGRYLVRGGETESLEGDTPPARVVILEFDSVAQAKAWHSSPEYEKPKKIRQSASKGTVWVVEGA